MRLVFFHQVIPYDEGHVTEGHVYLLLTKNEHVAIHVKVESSLIEGLIFRKDVLVEVEGLDLGAVHA